MIFKRLRCFSSQHNLRVKVLFDIVYDDLIVRARHISHNKVLLKSRWKHAVPTVINMFSNNIDSSGGSAVEMRLHAVQLFESTRDLEISRLVLLFKRVFNVLVDFVKLVDDGHRCWRALLFFDHIF